MIMIHPDEIQIVGLDLPVRIGVPTEEREHWQVLSADITLELARGFDTMTDELSCTLDYSVAANQARDLAAGRPRLLLETLAAELVGFFLEDDRVDCVEVTLRKRILPGTNHVAVRMRRSKRVA
ncbi:dihydroneopterin aldolase [Verrucomicrobium spinosum]|uniref:dihydroneopterin aldolase n=2 Tax=Verrucomicrobium spinosum TaxID=2736 RepID=UPI0001745B80|nr:dihydroneopterin aldolase [Verrucomicrobium spinosum]